MNTWTRLIGEYADSINTDYSHYEYFTGIGRVKSSYSVIGIHEIRLKSCEEIELNERIHDIQEYYIPKEMRAKNPLIQQKLDELMLLKKCPNKIDKKFRV